MQLSPNAERLELERETANESLAAPRDLSWPRRPPVPRTKTMRETMLDDWFFGFWMRYEPVQNQRAEEEC